MNRPEERLQRAIVSHLRLRLKPRWLFWHTPNGGGRSKAEAGVLKAMGTRPGIPDLFVLGPDRTLVALELKAPPKPTKRGALSKAKPALSLAQRDTIQALEACGVPTVVVRDLDDAIAVLSTLGAIRGREM